MATPSQLTANSANAQYSTGPQSAEAKARVALNPLTHGLSRSKIFLPNEAPEEFETTQAELSSSFGCTTPVEASIVAQAALAFWKIRRVNEWQIEIIDSALNGPDMPPALARLFGATHEAALKILHRYEASAQSAYNRAITQLRMFRKERGADVKAELQSRAVKRFRNEDAEAEAIIQQYAFKRPGAPTLVNAMRNEANPISRPAPASPQSSVGPVVGKLHVDPEIGAA